MIINNVDKPTHSLMSPLFSNDVVKQINIHVGNTCDPTHFCLVALGDRKIRSVVDTVGFTIYHMIEEKLYQDIPGKWLLKKNMILPTGNLLHRLLLRFSPCLSSANHRTKWAMFPLGNVNDVLADRKTYCVLRCFERGMVNKLQTSYYIYSICTAYIKIGSLYTLFCLCSLSRTNVETLMIAPSFTCPAVTAISKSLSLSHGADTNDL